MSELEKNDHNLVIKLIYKKLISEDLSDNYIFDFKNKLKKYYVT